MLTILREYLLSPRGTCLGCGSVRGTDHDWLCADCYAALSPLGVNGLSLGSICKNCGEEYTAGTCRICGKRKVETIQTVAAYDYEGPIRKLVHAFKFNGVWRLNEWMAQQMLLACTDGFLDGVTCVTAVPMHTLRRLARGYNQSEKLAKAFSRQANLPYKALIRRVRNTKQQVKLGMEARRQNLKDAFRAIDSPQGESVLLIDDVRTTGTTAIECVKTLLAAGAKEIKVLTFAKAVTHKSDTKKYRPDKGIKRLKPPKDDF